MERMTSSSVVSGGAGSASTWDAFLRTEASWTRLKNSSSSSSFFASNSNNDSMPSSLFVTDDHDDHEACGGNPKCWEKLRNAPIIITEGTNAATTATTTTTSYPPHEKRLLDYDVTICGGTLGIFIATSLLVQNPKLRIAVIESAKTIAGREQEWNTSRRELQILVDRKILTQQELEYAIITEIPGCRAGFKNREVTPLHGSYFENGETGYECYIPNILSTGVSPSRLIETVAARFRALGGTILDNSTLKSIAVSESVGAALELLSNNPTDKTTTSNILTSRLVLDCMGYASPISQQQRYGQKPDGVCAVVGTCAGGYDKETNLIGDILYTNTEMQVIKDNKNEKAMETTQVLNDDNKDTVDDGENGTANRRESSSSTTESRHQYFWEAFPVGIGSTSHGRMEPGTSDVKTTYMFTYMDASEGRPSLTTLMDDYWRLLPLYQPSITNVEKDLDVKRMLFAYFPSYKDSPLKPQWSRILAVGDASGIQSPLSFGGFRAMTSHLGRISSAVLDALDHDLLQKDDLGMINPYTPSLSVAWMFQRGMSVRVNQKVNPKFVNRLMAVNFEAMHNMGIQSTMMPFLKDVVRIDGLLGSLARSFVADPAIVPQVIAHVGVSTLFEWMGHVSMLATYHALHTVVSPILRPVVESTMGDNPKERFRWRRRMEAWKFGSGNDYVFEDPNENK